MTSDINLVRGKNKHRARSTHAKVNVEYRFPPFNTFAKRASRTMLLRPLIMPAATATNSLERALATKNRITFMNRCPKLMIMTGYHHYAVIVNLSYLFNSFRLRAGTRLRGMQCQ